MKVNWRTTAGALTSALLAATAVSINGVVSGADAVAEKFAAYDANHDQRLSEREFPVGAIFASMDRDGDGSLSLAEARRAVARGDLKGVQLPTPLPAETPPTEAAADAALGLQDTRWLQDSLGLQAESARGPLPAKATELGVGRLVPDFEFDDIRGQSYRLSELTAGEAPASAVVIAMTGTGCPLCKKYAPSIAAIEKAYQDKGVRFIFLNPNESERDDRVLPAIAAHGFLGPYVRDTEEAITGLLDVKTTTEIFVLDSARTLVYRGAVDDQFGFAYSLDAPRRRFLIDALDAVLAGESPRVSATTSPGCEMYYTRHQSGQLPEPQITYHNRVSRLIARNCLECHRDGGSAPFSLSDYASVKDYAGMIAKVVRGEIRGVVMPPWFAAESDGSAAHMDLDWANDRSLTDADKQALLTWVRSGVPEGDPADAPLPVTFPDDWAIGTPDLELQLPTAIPIKANGQMPYQHARVATRLKEDKWVQAVEIRPTDAGVVHHVLVYIRDANGKKAIDEEAGFFAAYVPGNTYQQYPSGMAKHLPAGSELVFQLHYTPNGIATTDQTRLGIVFSDQPPRRVIRNKGIGNQGIRIPSGADAHHESASFPVSTDVRLLSFLPHMHLRGKSFRYDVTTPDGVRRALLDIPQYDFNWQLEYRLAEPLAIASGSRIHVTGVFDNDSESNPAITHEQSEQEVRWGPQTTDEMLLGYVEYYLESETVSDE